MLDSKIITIKQHVWFKGRILLDQLKNGRPSAIIYFHMPDIW